MFFSSQCRRRLQLFSGGILLLLSCHPGAPQNSLPRTTPLDLVAKTPECQTFLASLPADVNQDFVRVPEDWDHPEGPSIDVAFFYGKSTTITLPSGVKPRRDIAFFNGGPASSSHGAFFLRQWELKLPLRFVFIDQRGTGCSTPYPNADSTASIDRIRFYTSRSIIKDAEAIRKKILGQDATWSIFGQSFGSLIVHRYLEEAPQNLDAAYAHGFAAVSDPKTFVVERLRATGRNAEAYFKQYPDDAALVDAIRAQIQSDFCIKSAQQKLCGPAMLDGAAFLLGFADQWSHLHEQLGKMLDSTGALQLDILQNYVLENDLDGSDTAVASWVISLTEITAGLDDKSSCEAGMNQLESEGLSPKSWRFNECRLLSALTFDGINADPSLSQFSIDPLRIDVIENQLTKFPKLPLYLYAGQKDSLVPAATFKEEAAALGDRITYREFPNSGHDGFYSERQVWIDLLSPVKK